MAWHPDSYLLSPKNFPEFNMPNLSNRCSDFHEMNAMYIQTIICIFLNIDTITPMIMSEAWAPPQGPHWGVPADGDRGARGQGRAGASRAFRSLFHFLVCLKFPQESAQC